MINIFNMDCLDFLESDECKKLTEGRKCIIVTDPPFNVGYHYNEYKDRKSDTEYIEFLKSAFTRIHTDGLVVIHYPETLYKIAFALNQVPTKICTWVYNSNTAKQHRDIAYFGIRIDQALLNIHDEHNNIRGIHRYLRLFSHL